MASMCRPASRLSDAKAVQTGSPLLSRPPPGPADAVPVSPHSASLCPGALGSSWPDGVQTSLLQPTLPRPAWSLRPSLLLMLSPANRLGCGGGGGLGPWVGPAPALSRFESVSRSPSHLPSAGRAHLGARTPWRLGLRLRQRGISKEAQRCGCQNSSPSGSGEGKVRKTAGPRPSGGVGFAAMLRLPAGWAGPPGQGVQVGRPWGRMLKPDLGGCGETG